MENLPIFINIIFIGALLSCMFLFYFSNSRPIRAIVVILILCLAQSILALLGFYENTDAFPPRFLLVFFPSAFFIAYGLQGRYMKWLRMARVIELSTLLHIVRIPVEIVLFNLFENGLVPELMTFEGRNYDILVGMTAPIMAFLYWKKLIGRKVLLLWNYVGLCLVLFIFVNAVLSLELPFQQFGFDQANVAVKYFPFVLLPVAIVPIVVWTHIGDIILLSDKISEKS